MTAQPKHILSKSTFMYGCQCIKRLWLHKFMPQVRDEEDESHTAIFQQGEDIGLLAQQKFPHGINAKPETPFEYQKSVIKTAELIQAGENIIYEAAFQFNGMLCAIDILAKKNNKWLAYEVKSSTKAKDIFIQDIAFQYYVITNSGLSIEDIFILHLNNEYVRYGELNLNELFVESSVLKKVLNLQSFIKEKIVVLENILKLEFAPDIQVGSQCSTPYECDFQTYCNTGIIPQLIDYGKPYINKAAIKDFIQQFEYPLYFMDFETWSSAIPLFDGHWTYRQVPFQFSVHLQKEKSSPIKHFEYLAEGINSNLEIFTTELIKILENKGSIIVYNKSFENTRLNELKEDFPQYKKGIEAIQERLVDLMIPFRKNYRLPEMQGSYSIKYVLPALVPELSYKNMEIGNGGDASSAFYNLYTETDINVINNTRNALLKYCELDTLAMVKILEVLKREIRF